MFSDPMAALCWFKQISLVHIHMCDVLLYSMYVKVGSLLKESQSGLLQFES